MKEQTKIYSWLPWAVAFLTGTVLFWSIQYFGLRWPVGPWEIAQHVDTIRAINEFGSGMADMESYWEERLYAFSGLAILFVLGPSLWIISEIRNQEREISEAEDQLKKGPIWYVGVIMVVIGLNYALPVTIIKGVAFNNTWEGADRNREVDRMRSELLTLAADAAEFYFLSHREGEGDGFGVKKSETGGFSLKDLKNYEPETSTEYLLGDAISDSSLIIYAVSNLDGSNPDFNNANGEKGKIQLAVEVRPEDELFEFIRTKTDRNIP